MYCCVVLQSMVMVESRSLVENPEREHYEAWIGEEAEFCFKRAPIKAQRLVPGTIVAFFATK